MSVVNGRPESDPPITRHRPTTSVEFSKKPERGGSWHRNWQAAAGNCGDRGAASQAYFGRLDGQVLPTPAPKYDLEALSAGSLYFLGQIQQAPNARTVTVTCRVWKPDEQYELRLPPLNPEMTELLRVRLVGPWTAAWVGHLCMHLDNAIQIPHPDFRVEVDLQGETWELENLLTRLVPLLRWFREDERHPGGASLGNGPSDRDCGR